MRLRRLRRRVRKRLSVQLGDIAIQLAPAARGLHRDSCKVLSGEAPVVRALGKFFGRDVLGLQQGAVVLACLGVPEICGFLLVEEEVRRGVVAERVLHVFLGKRLVEELGVKRRGDLLEELLGPCPVLRPLGALVAHRVLLDRIHLHVRQVVRLLQPAEPGVIQRVGVPIRLVDGGLGVESRLHEVRGLQLLVLGRDAVPGERVLVERVDHACGPVPRQRLLLLHDVGRLVREDQIPCRGVVSRQDPATGFVCPFLDFLHKCGAVRRERAGERGLQLLADVRAHVAGIKQQLFVPEPFLRLLPVVVVVVAGKCLEKVVGVLLHLVALHGKLGGLGRLQPVLADSESDVHGTLCDLLASLAHDLIVVCLGLCRHRIPPGGEADDVAARSVQVVLFRLLSCHICSLLGV